MTVEIKLTAGTWVHIDASAESVLITGGRFRLFMNGNTAPVAGSKSHAINGPYTIAKGLGAYITADGPDATVVASVLLQSSSPPVSPVLP